MRIVLLLTAVLVYSVAFAQESDDSANDDTRAMCIAVLLPALVATNQVEPDYNLAASNLMIQAHTIRATGLNCFMNLEGNLYHVFVSFGEPSASYVVAYGIQDFNTWDASVFL